jgi:hypothetical protein
MVISVTEQLRSPLRSELVAELRPEIERVVRAERDHELADLGESLERLRDENAILKDQERQLRREREDIRRKEEDFDLLLAREVDRSRRELMAEAEGRARDAYLLKLKDRDETIQRMTRDLEAARRRAHQPSSELQGSVQEVALDEHLRAAFPDDEISRVAKGRAGADIIQSVRTRSGEPVGTIIWESKRAKVFGRDWIPTLKGNARAARADAAVLVTSMLPDGAPLTEREGVWVVSLALVGPVGAMLRGAILAVAQTKSNAERRDGLAGCVYDYLTSGRFKDLVMGALELITKECNVQQQEQSALARRNAQRWEFLHRLAGQWAMLVGDLEGLGAELRSIPVAE